MAGDGQDPLTRARASAAARGDSQPQGAYFAVLADPAIGGTYLTLLNTFANLGSAWPRYPIMTAVDLFTKSACLASGLAVDGQGCGTAEDRDACAAYGGTCQVVQDGYTVVALVSVALGLAYWLVVLRRIIAVRARAPWPGCAQATPCR